MNCATQQAIRLAKHWTHIISQLNTWLLLVSYRIIDFDLRSPISLALQVILLNLKCSEHE